MKKIKFSNNHVQAKILIALAVTIFTSSVVLLPLSINAEANSTQDQSSSIGSDRGDVAKPRNGVKAALDEMRETAKLKAIEQAEAIRSEAKARKIEFKKDVCEKRQAKLATIPSRVTKNSSVLQNVLDRKYTRVQDFYASKNLTIANYETLKQNVDTAQASAQAAVISLSEFNITINCDNPGIGQQLDGLRLATNDAKTKLKAYRKALVDLITAISESLEANNTEQASGGDQ